MKARTHKNPLQSVRRRLYYLKKRTAPLNMPNQKQNPLPRLLLLTYFLLILSVGLMLSTHRESFYLRTDGNEYLRPALAFAATWRMTSERNTYYEAPRDFAMPEAYRSLLLPFLTGCAIKTGLPPKAAMPLLQAIFAALTAWLIFLSAQKIGGSRAAWCAVGCFILLPSIQFNYLQFSSEALFMLLIVLTFYAFLRRRESAYFASLMGCAGALALWTRPTGLLLLPAGGAVLLADAVFSCPGERAARLRTFVLFTLVFCAGIFPNALRNRVCFGDWSPTGYLGGFTLRFGSRPENLAAYRAGGGKDFLRHQDEAWEKTLAEIRALPPELAGDPVGQNRILQARALRDIRTMGVSDYAFLVRAKAWHFLRPWPMTGIHSTPAFLLLAVTECAIYLLGFTGLVLLCLKFGRDGMLFAALVLTFMAAGCLAHALVHLNFRYRIPFVDLVLLIPAGICLMSCKRFLFRQNEADQH